MKNLIYIFLNFSNKKLEQKSSENTFKNKFYYFRCIVDRSLDPQIQGHDPQNSFTIHDAVHNGWKLLCVIQWPKIDLDFDPMASIDPDCVKEINYAIQQLKFHLRHDRMGENASDPDKNLNIDFWADLDGQNTIRRSELIPTIII